MFGFRAPPMRSGPRLQRPDNLVIDPTHQKISHHVLQTALHTESLDNDDINSWRRRPVRPWAND
jgi:hypothetical protein